MRRIQVEANFLRAINHTSLVIGHKEHLPDQCLYCCDADRKWRTPDRNLGHWECGRYRGSRELKSVTNRTSNLNCGADDLLRLFSWIYQGYDSNDAVFHWQVECLRVPSSRPSVSVRFRDLHGPVIALPCGQGVAQQFLNFLPLPQGQ